MGFRKYLISGSDTGPRGAERCSCDQQLQGLPAGLSSGFPDPSSPRALLFLLVVARMQDGVFSLRLLAEKANIQKYFDNDVLHFPEAV